MNHLLLLALLGPSQALAANTGSVTVLLRNTGVGNFAPTDSVTVFAEGDGTAPDRSFIAPISGSFAPGTTFSGATSNLLVYDGTQGTYEFTVRYVDADGIQTVTLASNVQFPAGGSWWISSLGLTSTHPGAAAGIPIANTAPSALEITDCEPDATNPAQDLDIAWALPASRPADFDRYLLQRADLTTGAWSTVATFTTFGTTSFEDTNLSPGTTYRYRLLHRDRYDADTIGSEVSCVTGSGDEDADGHVSSAYGGTDCDDTSAAVHPGATEIADDGIDQDCDGYDLESPPDPDGDGFLDNEDNCPDDANEDQADLDGDGAGDACDADDDNDGVADEVDLCPDAPDPDQADLDGDLSGDACDLDDDDDGVDDDVDVCPRVADPDQLDLDRDLVGDACDGDDDGDGVADDVDVCPDDVDPDQEDADGDGTGDACDPFTDTDGDLVVDDEDVCPTVFDEEQLDADGDGAGDACDVDDDNDGVADDDDVCPFNADPLQADADGDGAGNACDADDDDDGVEDAFDNCVFAANASQFDEDGDGYGDACDDDDDDDAVGDDEDNCAIVENPDQFDNDADGAGDACDDDDDNDGVLDDEDNCGELANTDQSDLDGDGIGDVCDADDDDDGVLDAADNCPEDPNEDQLDNDGDGDGDLCDDDDDDDLILDEDDLCATIADPDQSDLDCDGEGDACDDDMDGDGVVDDMDACPDVPAFYDVLSPDGCPDEVCDLVDWIVTRATSEFSAQARNSIRTYASMACSAREDHAMVVLGLVEYYVRLQRGRTVAPDAADRLLGAIDWIQVEYNCSHHGEDCEFLDPCVE